MNQLFGVAGIAAILALAWLLSANRKAIRLRVVAAAFALQAGIALLVLYTPWGRAARIRSHPLRSAGSHAANAMSG